MCQRLSGGVQRRRFGRTRVVFQRYHLNVIGSARSELCHHEVRSRCRAHRFAVHLHFVAHLRFCRRQPAQFQFALLRFGFEVLGGCESIVRFAGRSLHHFNIVDHNEAPLLVGFAVVVEIQAHTRVVGTGRRGESQHLLLPLVGNVRGVVRFVLARVLFQVRAAAQPVDRNDHVGRHLLPFVPIGQTILSAGFHLEVIGIEFLVAREKRAPVRIEFEGKLPRVCVGDARREERWVDIPEERFRIRVEIPRRLVVLVVAVLVFVAVLVGGFAIGANLVATCGGRRGIFLKTAVRNDVLPHLCGECRGQEGEEPEK